MSESRLKKLRTACSIACAVFVLEELYGVTVMRGVRVWPDWYLVLKLGAIVATAALCVVYFVYFAHLRHMEKTNLADEPKQ